MSPESTFDENRAESEFGIVVARVGQNDVGAGRRGFVMGWGERIWGRGAKKEWLISLFSGSLVVADYLVA